MRAAPVAAIGAALLLTVGRQFIPESVKKTLQGDDQMGMGMAYAGLALGAWGVWSLLKGGK